MVVRVTETDPASTPPSPHPNHKHPMAPLSLVKKGEAIGQLAAVAKSAPSSGSSDLPVDPLLVRPPRAALRPCAPPALCTHPG